jgi:hypothetical protein
MGKIDETLTGFIIAHKDDDPTRLLLSREHWPEVDVALAATSIEARNKVKVKLPTWYSRDGIVYPTRLSAEQCSSEATACYKAALAKRIMAGEGSQKGVIADLTSGLGVDDWTFSYVSRKLIFNDMNPLLVDAAAHNFHLLPTSPDCRIEFRNEEAGPGKLDKILGSESPDIVFMDPARRESGTGKKVYRLRDCSPDVLSMLPELSSRTRNVLLKLSPMADISQISSELAKASSFRIKELHVVETEGECKEILVWLAKDADETKIMVAAQSAGKFENLSFGIGEESSAEPMIFSESEDSLIGSYIFEPGKALSKSGQFKAFGQRLGIPQLGISTHLYVSKEPLPAALKAFGKTYKVDSVRQMTSQNIKAMSKEGISATLSARNVPLTAEALSSRLRLRPSQTRRIFACRVDFLSANYLFLTSLSSVRK